MRHKGHRRRHDGLPATRLIALFVLLSVVPLILLTSVTVHVASEEITSEAKARLRSTAVASAVAIEKELQGLAELVASFATRPKLIETLASAERGRPRQVDVRLHLRELYDAHPGIATAFLATPDGTLVDIVPPTPSIVGKDFSYRDWYRGAVTTGRPYVSEAYQSLAANRPHVVGIASEIRSDSPASPRLGIVVAGYDIHFIQGYVDRFAASQGVSLTVTDQYGHVVASPGRHSPHVDSELDGDPLVSAALAGRSGVVVRDGSEGREIAAFAPAGRVGWTVTATVSESSALSGARKIRSTVTIVVGALSIMLLIGLVVLLRTLKQRRRAEELAHQSSEKAERSRREADQARAEAERANRAKSEFLSRMSHELRTPLNAVLGFAQLLEMDGLTNDQRESVRHILKGGRHLLELINEVLDIARIESGSLVLSVEPTDVRDILDEIVDLVAPLAAGVGTRVEQVPFDGQPLVLADRQRLKQVVLNLVSNAIKYNGGAAVVTISMRSVNDHLRIAVRDSGAGIPSDQLERLFVPFDRLDAADGETEGSGLGLTISKRLTEAMGGSIGVETAPGEGSTFWVELPMVASPHEIVLDEVEPSGERDGAATVLCIDDDLENLALIERVVAYRPDVRLISAMFGHLGLDLARQHRPDAILAHLTLPDMSGEELLHRLGTDDATARIPVIVTSGNASPADVSRLLSVGARAYITKPVDVEAFLDCLDAVLKERQP